MTPVAQVPTVDLGQLGLHRHVDDGPARASPRTASQREPLDVARFVPDRLPEGATLPGHYDPASGQTAPARGLSGAEGGLIPGAPSGLGGKP